MRENNIKPAEAAEILGVSPQFIRVAMQMGQLPISSYKLLSFVLFFTLLVAVPGLTRRLLSFPGSLCYYILYNLRHKNL